MGELIDEVRVCNSGKHPDENVPLLFTFQFPYKEYWCPACGKTYGMLGAGKIISEKIEEAEKFQQWREKGEEYLDALAHDPDVSKDQRKLLDNWKYKYTDG